MWATILVAEYNGNSTTEEKRPQEVGGNYIRKAKTMTGKTVEFADVEGNLNLYLYLILISWSYIYFPFSVFRCSLIEHLYIYIHRNLSSEYDKQVMEKFFAIIAIDKKILC